MIATVFGVGLADFAFVKHYLLQVNLRWQWLFAGGVLDMDANRRPVGRDLANIASQDATLAPFAHAARVVRLKATATIADFYYKRNAAKGMIMPVTVKTVDWIQLTAIAIVAIAGIGY